MNLINRRRIFAVASILLLSTLTLPALASPPQGGGTGGGTIYFASGGVTMTMNSDGSNKTALPAGVSGEPSLGMHGGHRWFIQSRNLVGQTYPNGKTRRELFATRDDGNTAFEIQLTNQPDLENNYWVRWSPGDTAISFAARRWDLGAGQIASGGIYSANVQFDGSGNLLPVAVPPSTALVPIGLVLWPANQGGVYAGEMGTDIQSFSWAPSGTQLVYESMARTTLRVATIGGGVTTILNGTWCAVPAWSPTGTPIAYTSQQSGISTIRPDGTGIVQLSKRTPSISYAFPCWSPTGTFIVYEMWDGTSFPYPQDVGRMTSSGKSKTNLTSSLATGGAPMAWR